MTRAANNLTGTTTPTTPCHAEIARRGFCFAKQQATPRAWQFSGEQARAVAAVVVEDSTPRRKFVKDLIRAGKYVANGREVSLSIADLDELAEQTTAYIANGNQVPVPDGHTDSATANRGYALEVFREGDTLYGVLEMIGDDGIKTASRSKVSINTDVNYTDGKGTTYPHVITHVALTNTPVVPDQNGFVPLAASRGGKSTRALVLSLAPTTESNMEHLTKIAAMLGVEGVESLDEAGLAAAIAKAIEAMKGMSKTATEEAEKVKAELSGVKASLSKQAPEPDPVLLRIAGENRTMKLDKLVADGKLTPAARDGIADVFIGKDNAGLKLSIDPAGDARFAALLDALAKNDAVKLGEQTRAQGVSLSRGTPGSAAPIDASKAAAELMGTIGIK